MGTFPAPESMIILIFVFSLIKITTSLKGVSKNSNEMIVFRASSITFGNDPSAGFGISRSCSVLILFSSIILSTSGSVRFVISAHCSFAGNLKESLIGNGCFF